VTPEDASSSDRWTLVAPSAALEHALIVDIESQSALLLPKVGTWRYAHHPTTRLLCAAFTFVNAPEAEEPLVWLPGDPLPAAVEEHLCAGGMMAAWNALFDISMLNRFMPPDIPRIQIEQIHDIAAQAASAGMPRAVEKCAAAMELPLNKDHEGHKAMRYLMKPRGWRNGKPILRGRAEEPERFAALVRYCQQDVRVERMLMRRLPRLQEIDRPVFEQDLRINLRGMLIDVELIRVGGPALMRALAAADRRMQEITEGAVRGISKRDEIVEFLQAHNVELIKPEENRAADGENGHDDLLQQAAIEPEDVDDENENTNENTSYRYADDSNKDEKPSTRGALTKAAVMAMLARNSLPPVVREVLELRHEYGRTSTAKLKTLAGVLDPEDSRVRDYIVFHAASTGRAGGRLLQPQNLPRDSVPPGQWARVMADLGALTPAAFLAKHGKSAVGGIVQLIRGAIIAPPEHILAGGDFSRIELVVGAWLAEAEGLLDDLRNGVDTYEQMAAAIYEIPVAQVEPKIQRQVGKSAMLGCTFGLGARTFKNYVLLSTRITIDEATAEKTIKLFREHYLEFPEAWHEIGHAARQAVVHPGVPQICLGGHVTFRCTPRRDWLTATLPSGRRLRYFKPTLSEETNQFGNQELVLRSWGVSSRTHQWTHEIKHGALLFQNCVSATARDLLMAACLRLEAAGLPVILHVHDEVLVEIPLSRGIAPRDVHRILTKRPAWAANMPIDAECWVSPRYGKVDKEKTKPEPKPTKEETHAK
jgi:DNA polymerase